MAGSGTRSPWRAARRAAGRRRWRACTRAPERCGASASRTTASRRRAPCCCATPEDLLVELRRSLEEYKPSLIVLDSISSVAHSTSARGFRQFMVGFASLVREHSRSALLTQAINDVKEDERTAPFLSTIADAVITLDYQRHGKHLERTLSVTKMRGSAHSDDAFRLVLRPGGLGIEELPETSP